MAPAQETNTEVCNLLVKIDGKEEIKATDQAKSADDRIWQIHNGVFVTALTVDQRLDAPDMFSLQFMGTREGQRVVYDFVKEGSTIELGFGYGAGQKPETVFKGEIIYYEVDIDAQGGTFVTLRGFDASHRLTRGTSAKTWGDGVTEDQVISDLVSEVIQDSKAEKGDKSDGLSADKVDSTEFKSRYIPKAMTSDYDFIKWAGSNLARASDSDQKDDKKISFRKLDISQNPVCTVCYDKMEGTNPVRMLRCNFAISTYPIYAKVRVHGWDTKEKKAFVGEIESCSPEIDCAGANGWTAGWQATGKAHWGSGSTGSTYERVMEFCENKDEAEKIAQGIFDGFSLRYLTGEAEIMGWPGIVPGCVVEFKGMGERTSGKVLVTEASHSISAAAGQPYVTSFKFCSNAAGDAK